MLILTCISSVTWSYLNSDQFLMCSYNFSINLKKTRQIMFGKYLSYICFKYLFWICCFCWWCLLSYSILKVLYNRCYYHLCFILSWQLKCTFQVKGLDRKCWGSATKPWTRKTALDFFWKYNLPQDTYEKVLIIDR